MTDQQIKGLEIFRIVSPIIMFGIVLVAFGWGLGVPLVLAVTLACLAGVFSFAVLSWNLSRKKKDL